MEGMEGKAGGVGLISEADTSVEGLSLPRINPGTHYAPLEMIGRSQGILQVFDAIRKVADSDSTVLITGESGTGKELVAQAIHLLSLRGSGPLIPVNCGAIPTELLESELFGHLKGSFTGAIQNKAGRFELAQGGSIFLDEIGDMPAHLQVKLLRVLQERTFEPVGSVKSVKSDVRIIAATNKILEDAVKDKTFREDLYYRLNVIPILIPPLRERRADIPVLLAYFLKRFNAQKKRTVSLGNPEVMDILLRYDWPGNVRELENLVERLVVFRVEGQVELKDLPPKIFERVELAGSNPGTQGKFGFASHTLQQSSGSTLQLSSGISCPRFILPDEGVDLRDLVNQFENDILLQALTRTRGNKNKASELLQMNRTTLVEKLKKKNLGGLVEEKPTTPPLEPYYQGVGPKLEV